MLNDVNSSQCLSKSPFRASSLNHNVCVALNAVPPVIYPQLATASNVPLVLFQYFQLLFAFFLLVSRSERLGKSPHDPDPLKFHLLVHLPHEYDQFHLQKIPHEYNVHHVMLGISPLHLHVPEKFHV